MNKYETEAVTIKAETGYERAQRLACEQLTRMLEKEHPEYQATISDRFGQVVVETAHAEHMPLAMKWLEALNTRRTYGTMNRSHLSNSPSDHKHLPKDVHDKKRAEDSELVVVKKSVGAEPIERMEQVSCRGSSVRTVGEGSQPLRNC